jgi:hypothetical protein
MPAQTVFFDIGGTLGEPRLSPPPDFHLERLDVYPHVAAALAALRRHGIGLGIISNIGEPTPGRIGAVRAALATAGLADFFAEELLVWGRKDNAEIFRSAAAKAGAAADQCVFVGEDASERRFAKEAGLRVAPHPLLALAVAQGEALRYARITAPETIGGAEWRSSLLDAGVIPLHVTGPGGTVVYVIASGAAIVRVMNMRFIVQLLGADDLPADSDLFLLRDDLAERTGFLTVEGQAAALMADPLKRYWVLASSTEGLHVAVPGRESVDTLHLQVARHGHTLKLSPDVTLLQPFGTGPNMRAAAFTSSAALAERELTDAELATLAAISEELIGGYVDRFTGASPLDGNGAAAVVTRHSVSEDNTRVVDAIARELEQIGGGAFTVRTTPFTFNGKTLHNVEAEWPGARPELVIVSAHLDSTAAASHGPGAPAYRPAVDAAPGADDDASGVAGVLSIARALRSMPVTRPEHSLRFVLFNAEEQGLVGSAAYARAQSSAAAPIAAVFQMDMIGRNSVPPPLFEVHAGYSPSPEVESRSLVLARRVARLREAVASRLDGPEVCRTKGPASHERDGAEGRSDHASFHARGYAACCVSEDLFMNDPGLPPAEVNEHYHKESDREINRRYAADIARVVAAAAWVTAQP